jgi:UMF1 family MFS transporter
MIQLRSRDNNPNSNFVSRMSVYTFPRWKQIQGTMKLTWALPHTRTYLLSYFIFSDGYGTLSSVGILFASDELGMDNSELIVIAAIVPIIAVIGAVFLGWVQERWKIQNRKMIIFCLSMIALIPAYACLGFIESSPIGLKSKNEMYGFSAFYGFPLAAVQSFARVQFNEVLPVGKGAQVWLFVIMRTASNISIPIFFFFFSFNRCLVLRALCDHG